MERSVMDKMQKDSIIKQRDIDLMVIDQIKFYELERENKDLANKLSTLTEKNNTLLIERASLVQQINVLNASITKLRNENLPTNLTDKHHKIKTKS